MVRGPYRTRTYNQLIKSQLLYQIELTAPKDGVDDGARTHDHWNHNPGLYQLSYIHHFVSLSINVWLDIWRARQDSNLLPSD